MAFPSSPANGQVAIQNGITYIYTSATNSWARASAALPSLSVITDTFVGDGITTSYTLSVAPVNKDFVSINIDGVSQLKTAYSVTNNVITFTGTPVLGAAIDAKTISTVNTSAITGLTYDSFTGDGSTSTFTLSATPTNKTFTIVSIGGITQNKTTYSVTGNAITFSTIPPNTAPIEVTTFGPAITSAVAAGANTQVQFNNNGAIAGSSNLTFNNTTNTLSIGGVTAATTGKSIAMSIVFGG